MQRVYTIPSIADIQKREVPEYMWANSHPFAVVQEAAFNKEFCERIIGQMEKLEPYSFAHCTAATRESYPILGCLIELASLTMIHNDVYWGYHISNDPAAWMQSYSPGGSYPMHTDGAIGQTRKLTSILLLSHEDAYTGGDLRIVPYPLQYQIPRTQGTVITFPAHILHEVSEVTAGFRQTINMGFWGPPFR